MKVTIKNLSKRFADKQVIASLNLVIEDGSFTTLLGPSGCGKTTLLRMIAGLETPDEGEIYLDRVCVVSKEKGIHLPPEKRELAFVFQDFALWPHMTVFENVAFGLRARKKTENLEERVQNALKSVRLEGFAQRYPHQLSGGQQQRVAFARAIVIEPGCILFDEPLSALDALLREEMRRELRELTKSLHITSIFVTHDQVEAMSMSDRIAVLHEGRVDQYDTPEAIYQNPASPFTAHFIGKSNWISDRELFRPEAAHFEPQKNAISYRGHVESVRYLGDCYELTVPYGDRRWTIPSKEKREVGEELTIFVDQGKIIQFSKQEGERK